MVHYVTLGEGESANLVSPDNEHNGRLSEESGVAKRDCEQVLNQDFVKRARQSMWKVSKPLWVVDD